MRIGPVDRVIGRKYNDVYMNRVTTIRAVFRDGALQPLDPVDLPENTRLTVALLGGDDLSADAIAELAGQDRAFHFLNDPGEDVYNESDGEAV